MLKLVLATVVMMMACKETSKAGSVAATINLRDRIKVADVAARAPTDEKATLRELAFDAHGANVKLVWRTWDDATASYILSVGLEVVTPKSGISLDPVRVLNPTNSGTDAKPIQSEIAVVRWHDDGAASTSYGDISIRFDASGQATIN